MKQPATTCVIFCAAASRRRGGNPQGDNRDKGQSASLDRRAAKCLACNLSLHSSHSLHRPRSNRKRLAHWRRPAAQGCACASADFAMGRSQVLPSFYPLRIKHRARLLRLSRQPVEDVKLQPVQAPAFRPPAAKARTRTGPGHHHLRPRQPPYCPNRAR